MIAESDKEFLEIIIFVTRSVATNDCVAAPDIVAKVNALTLTESNVNTLADALETENTCGYTPNGDDAYVILVNGIECIPGKEYKLKRHILALAVNQGDTVQLTKAIDAAVKEPELLDSSENDYYYISLLIRACTILKDYESMEIIRRKLVQ